MDAQRLSDGNRLLPVFGEVDADLCKVEFIVHRTSGAAVRISDSIIQQCGKVEV